MRALVCLVLLSAAALTAPRNSEGSFAPASSVSFPKVYADDLLLPGSISPNYRYALIIGWQLFLVDLKPFRVLAKPPIHGADNDRCAINWAADSSSVLVMEGARWGPAKIMLIEIKEGRATRPIDVAAEVRTIVEPNFKHSGAEPYNRSKDFVFVSDDERIEKDGRVFEPGWQIDRQRQVLIDCVCDSSPNSAGKRWRIRFKGIWDIAGAKFRERKMMHLESD